MVAVCGAKTTVCLTLPHPVCRSNHPLPRRGPQDGRDPWPAPERAVLRSGPSTGSGVEGESKAGIKTRLSKNNIITYQYVKRFVRHIPSTITHFPSYFAGCSHGDRVINRHSGGQAAYGSRAWLSRRAEPLSHVPPGPAGAQAKRAPARAKSRNRACGEPHPYRLVPNGRTTRPGRPLEFNGQTGNGAWQRGRLIRAC